MIDKNFLNKAIKATLLCLDCSQCRVPSMVRDMVQVLKKMHNGDIGKNTVLVGTKYDQALKNYSENDIHLWMDKVKERLGKEIESNFSNSIFIKRDANDAKQ